MENKKEKSYPMCPIFIKKRYFQELWLLIPACVVIFFFKQGWGVDIIICIWWLTSRIKATRKGWRYACDINMTEQFLKGENITHAYIEHEKIMQNERERIDHYQDIRTKVCAILTYIRYETIMARLVKYYNVINEEDTERYIYSYKNKMKGYIKELIEYENCNTEMNMEWCNNDNNISEYITDDIFLTDENINKIFYDNYKIIYSHCVPYVNYLDKSWTERANKDITIAMLPVGTDKIPIEKTLYDEFINNNFKYVINSKNELYAVNESNNKITLMFNSINELRKRVIKMDNGGKYNE